MNEWIATAIGVIGGIGGIGTILYWRQNKGSATAGVVKESMDALKSALETLTSQQEVFAITIKSKDDEIVVLKEQIKEVMFITGFPLLIITLTFELPFLMLLWIFSFYIWYSVEFLINLIRFKERRLAYRRISFEREAYTFETDLTYLNRNNNFAFFKYIK